MTAGVTGARRAVRPAVVVALVVLALALRLYRLGHEDFWIDEVFQIRVSSQPLRDIVANYRPGMEDTRLRRDQAPLSHLLTHFFVGEGNDEARARLPSAVCGALGVGVTYALAAELVPAGAALLAGVLLALSPLHLWYSQECRFYALWTLEAVVATLALVRALAGGGRAWWAAWVLATVAGMYTCIMHGLVVVAQALTLVWLGRLAGRTRAAVLGFGVALAVVALATLPVARVVLAEHDRPAGTERPPSLAALPYTVFAYAVGFSLGPTLDALHALPTPVEVVTRHPSVAVVFAVFVPVALLGARRLGLRSRAAAVVWPWLVVPPLGVLALSETTNVVYNVRYALASLPAFVVLVATGCLGAATRRGRAVATAAVLGCTLVSLGAYYWDETYDRAHVREALAYVAAGEAGAPRMLVVGDVVRAVDFYARGSRLTLSPRCELPEGEAAPERLWIAAGRDWDGGARRCLQSLAGRYRAAEQRGFVGVDLWRLERLKP